MLGYQPVSGHGRAAQPLSLALGRQAEVVGELWALVAEHPYRESMRRQLMLALYRSGRQAEALEVYRDGRRVLAEELGLGPGEPLRELELRILRHDPALVAAAGSVALPAQFPHRRAERPAGAPASGRQRRTLLATTLAGVVAAAISIPLLTAGHGGFGFEGRVAAVAGNSVAVVDLGSGRLVADVSLGTAPTDVAAGDGAVWVTNPDNGTVTRIDPDTGTIRQTVHVGDGASGVAVGAGAVWVANGLRGTVLRIDPETNEAVQTISAGNGPAGIAVGYGSVWVTSRDDHTVSEIDPRSGAVRTIEAATARWTLPRGLGRSG